MKMFINGKVYNEIYEVLKVKKEVMEKIPQEVLEHIYRSATQSGYKHTYNPEIDILKQISNDAFCLYLSLYLDYVASAEERERIKKMLIENEKKFKQKQ